MQAQSQMCFAEKALSDGRDPGLRAKILAASGNLFERALEHSLVCIISFFLFVC